MTALRVIQGGGTAQRTAVPSPTANSQFGVYRDALDDAALRALNEQAQQAFAAQHRIASQAQQSSSWSEKLDSVLEEIGRLPSNWAGIDSIAPPASVIDDIQALVSILPLGTREPEVEIDPSDGEVKIAWRCQLQPKSVAIALRGDGRAHVIQSNLDSPPATAHLEVGLSTDELRYSGRRLQTLEHCELFVKA